MSICRDLLHIRTAFLLISVQCDIYISYMPIKYLFTNTRCRSGYEVVTMSWWYHWYSVVMTLFCIAFSCLKVRVCSCKVGYAVTRFSITWVRSYTVFYYLGTQLHGFLLPGCAVTRFSITWACSYTVFYYLGIQLHGFLLPGHAVTLFSITWVRSYTVFYYLGTQLHDFLLPGYAVTRFSITYVSSCMVIS